MPSVVSSIPLQAPLAAIPGLTSFLVAQFAVENAIEGPQVIVSWGYPASLSDFANDVDEIRLLSRLGQYPESISDGKLLLSSTTFAETYYADFDVREHLVHYYAMFSHRKSDGAWVTNKTVRGYALPYRTGYYETRLWDLLPPLYRSFDAKTTQQVLAPTVVPTDLVDSKGRVVVRRGQTLNLYEDGVTAKGFLRRIIKLTSLEFDRVQGLLGHWDTLWDLDEAPPDFLPLLGDLVGVRLNRELSIPRQRDEIRRAVSIYKAKGRRATLEAQLQSLLSFPVVLDRLWDNIVIFADEIRQPKVFYSFDPDDMRLAHQAGDPNYYLPSDEATGPNFNTIKFFLQFDDALPFTREVAKKFLRIISDFLALPFLAVAVVEFSAAELEILAPEIEVFQDFDRFLTEESDDILETEDFDDVITAPGLFLTNTASSTNSATSLTPRLQP